MPSTRNTHQSSFHAVFKNIDQDEKALFEGSGCRLRPGALGSAAYVSALSVCQDWNSFACHRSLYDKTSATHKEKSSTTDANLMKTCVSCRNHSGPGGSSVVMKARLLDTTQDSQDENGRDRASIKEHCVCYFEQDMVDGQLMCLSDLLRQHCRHKVSNSNGSVLRWRGAGACFQWKGHGRCVTKPVLAHFVCECKTAYLHMRGDTACD